MGCAELPPNQRLLENHYRDRRRNLRTTLPPHQSRVRLAASESAVGSSKTGQEPGPSLLPRHGCRRITVMFREPAFAFSSLSFCQTRNAVRRRGDAIPKILCKLNSLSRTELQQFCQQCLIACH